MRSPTKKIEDFCHTGSGGTPSRSKSEYFEAGTIPWVKSGELKARFVTNTEEAITDAAVKNSSVKLVPKGSLLIAMYGATVGEVSELAMDAATNQAICHIVPDPNVCDRGYLFQYLSSIKSELLDRRVGGGQPNISQAIIKSLEVPLPALSEQRRIAAILDKADALRAKRREAIAKLDQLLQSVFLEMFGDPVTNPKGWPMKLFGEVCESSFRNGLSPSTSGSVPGKVLTLSAITRQRFQSNHQKEALFDRPPSDNQQVKMDTFLICRGNGNRQLVGVGVFPNHDLYDVCFPDTMIGANIAKDRASPRFIEQIWGSRLVRNQIESGASTTNGTFKINQRTLEKILIPIPPRELQAQFEIISTKLMTMRVRMSIHSGLIDENFRSLQHRMFGAL
ncbi:restriction endonuclease subunit S [Pseudomonas chlororaphis]